MKNNSAIKWLWNITGKKKIYIVILLAVQTVLDASSIFYALFLRNIIDFTSEKDIKGFVAYFVSIMN